ncbi:MAG: CotH kinase family protein [Muribaculaceae bacterium]|nr:CotH kinase family protein [Muribaculaceae bacterium]
MKCCDNILARVALTLMLALMSASGINALNLLPGNYCFDNSKLHFSQVKMVVGNVTSEFTHVYDMTPVDGRQWWEVTTSESLENLNYFTFVETDTPAGTFSVRINVFLDSLAHASGGIRRTGLNANANINWEYCNRWVYCPLKDDRLSNGYWRPASSYDATASSTLPVIYLTTQDSVPIISKDIYIAGTLWIDDANNALGTNEEQLPIEVKGRGNWTWKKSLKKPYKVKFATKQSPLGLDRSRHFVLLAHNEDYSGYLRNATGFELSRQMGMPYTPREVPVELVLNGDYEGLYFLCEKIRVEDGRVDIWEQADMEMIPDNVTGGWLLELTDDGNIVIDQYQNNDPANSRFTFVTQSPEQLSQVQRNYIHDLLARADSCIYVPDKTDDGWEQILDIHSLAQFYVIHEVMDNVEAFSGSLFLYKDLGWDEKLMFGPVWDFDNSFYQESTTSNHFIYDYDTPFTFLWIKEALKFPRLQEEIRSVWRKFCTNHVLDHLIDNAWQWRELVVGAEQQDRLRWPFYASTHADYKPAEYLDVIAKKAAWLNAQWGKTGDVNMDGVVSATDITVIYNYLLNGDQQYPFSSDLDGDGIITAIDITIIYNILLN